MKDKIDFRLLGALLRKQRQEQFSRIGKGKFDFVGFGMRVVLILAFLVCFVVFFGRFLEIYLQVKTDYVLNPSERLFEILTAAYTLVLVLMTVGAVSQINHALFAADDMRILAALPVGAKTLYLSKLIVIYVGQIGFALLTVLPVNIAVAVHAPQGAWFYGMTALTCLVLPLVSIAIASVLALPYHAVRTALKNRFALHFIVVTLLTAALLFVYAAVLEAVKELLLGDDLKYFFNEAVMDKIAAAAAALYPANWMARFLLGQDAARNAIFIAVLLAGSAPVSLIAIRLLLMRALQSRISGASNFIGRRKTLRRPHSPFVALLKKEFLTIFRTPNYTFSYFSVAVVMPLMVYFCMSVGSSLAVKLIGIQCNAELAVFLTLLFGSLANMFCTTNISRDGKMFFSVKAMPVDARTVFLSKVILCMIVTAVSQLISAVLLLATGYLNVWAALFLFASGVLCGFAQVCVATKIDFRHPDFSAEADGEIRESGNTVSTVVVLGLLASFLIGGAVLLVRMMLSLRGLADRYAYLTYLITGVIALGAAAAGYFLLAHRLDKKYRAFDGGGAL